MSYRKLTLNNKPGKSLLGQAAVTSLTPGRRIQEEGQRNSPSSPKYKYLTEVSNQNQKILKEMLAVDQKYLNTLQTDARPVAQANDLPNYGFNSSLNKVEESRTQKFIKSQVRNTTFDPITGCEKKYNTPLATFNALGTNGGDLYTQNGLFRRAAPSKFQTGLRA